MFCCRFAAVPDKFGQTAWDYARAHGPAHVEENGASGGIPLLELPGLCATEAACQELEVCAFLNFANVCKRADTSLWREVTLYALSTRLLEANK